MNQEIYSVADAAKRAGCSTRTIQRWIAAGLKADRGGTDQTMIAASDLDVWIASRAATDGADEAPPGPIWLAPGHSIVRGRECRCGKEIPALNAVEWHVIEFHDGSWKQLCTKCQRRRYLSLSTLIHDLSSMGKDGVVVPSPAVVIDGHLNLKICRYSNNPAECCETIVEQRRAVLVPRGVPARPDARVEVRCLRCEDKRYSKIAAAIRKFTGDAAPVPLPPPESEVVPPEVLAAKERAESLESVRWGIVQALEKQKFDGTASSPRNGRTISPGTAAEMIRDAIVRLIDFKLRETGLIKTSEATGVTQSTVEGNGHVG